MTAQQGRLALWVVATAFVCALGYLTLNALVPFAIGAIISYSLAPLVDRLMALIPLHQPKHEAWRRGLAVLLIYVIFFGALAAAAFSLIPMALEQIVHFIQELPATLESIREQSNGVLQAYRERTPQEVQVRLDAMVEQAASTVAAMAGAAAQRTLLTVTSTVGFIFGLAVLPFWMFYTMRDRKMFVPTIVGAAPVEVREDVRMMLGLADDLLGRYIRAQLLLGVVVGVAVGGLLAGLGVELSLGLGVWAGITELIPMIGPWLGAIPGLILIAATDPGMLPWVALVYLAVQQVENNFLVPRIQGEALHLHPALVILVLAVGGAAWGFIGLVTVVPGTAIVRELFWYIDRRLRGQSPAQAFAASHLNGGTHEPAEAAPVTAEAGR